MEALAALLGALGLAGLLAAVVLGGTVFVILPLWAILHCAASDRPGGVKLFLVAALVLTWGAGAVFYGLFASGSRAFRAFTVIAVLLPVAILVPAVIGLGAGASIHARTAVERERAETASLVETFRPEVLSAERVEPFVALLIAPTGGSRSATLATFAADGPVAATARAIDGRVRHVARDAAHGRDWALTDHEFGSIDPESGALDVLEVDPAVGRLSWPKGVAYDPERERVVVLTSHVETGFWTFDPRTSAWRRLPATYRDLPLVGLTYSAEDDGLYAVERRAGDRALRRIHRFNADGASLGTIAIDPPIPWAGDDAGLQIRAVPGHLVVVLPPPDPRLADAPVLPRVLYVDRDGGRVRVPGA